MAKSVAGTSKTPKRKEVENPSRRKVEWSSNLTKVSTAAVALAAISGAAVTFKSSLWELIGISSSSEGGEPANKVEPEPTPPPVLVLPSAPLPGTTVTTTITEFGPTRDLAGTSGVGRVWQVTTTTTNCQPGFTRDGGPCLPPPSQVIERPLLAGCNAPKEMVNGICTRVEVVQRQTRSCDGVEIPIAQPCAPGPFIVFFDWDKEVVQPQTKNCDGVEIPVARECAIGPFIVFFDWDEDEITPQAASILDNAASAYQQAGEARVVLTGHADRSGSDQYNVGLSQRRSENVRQYLAGRGIAEGVIRTQAFGESQPAVDTGDGVREPQNRRVEISFGPQ
ncbi:MAG TPA: OmpA family protein [Allosphingosinicella sp.]|jgi:outer membrane protein OmpA-like peptidoglycan-associated protein